MGRKSLIDRIKSEGLESIYEEEIEEGIYSFYLNNDYEGMKEFHDVFMRSIYSKLKRSNPFALSDELNTKDNLSYFMDFISNNYLIKREELDDFTYELDGDYDKTLDYNEVGPIQEFYRESVGYNPFPLFGFYGYPEISYS